MEKSQHTDFNEDTTRADESASVACSNVNSNWKTELSNFYAKQTKLLSVYTNDCALLTIVRVYKLYLLIIIIFIWIWTKAAHSPGWLVVLYKPVRSPAQHKHERLTEPFSNLWSILHRGK